jgi:hypothetical protein
MEVAFSGAHVCIETESRQPDSGRAFVTIMSGGCEWIVSWWQEAREERRQVSGNMGTARMTFEGCWMHFIIVPRFIGHRSEQPNTVLSDFSQGRPKLHVRAVTVYRID